MRTLRWAVALLGSALVHLGGIAAAGLFVTPDATPQQSNQKAQLSMQAQVVARKTAAEQPLPDQNIANLAPDAATVTSDGPQMQTAAALPLLAAPLVDASAESSTQIAELPPIGAPVVSDLPQTATLPSLDAADIPVDPLDLPMKRAALPAVEASPATAQPLDALNTRPTEIAGISAPQLDMAPQMVTAATAPFIGERVVSDPASIAAFEALSADSQQTELRDDLSAILAGPECSRLSAVFQPDTGQIELHGHVPEAGAGAPVLSALQQMVGTDIVVTQNILVLPQPQCAALAGISDIGLPQSTDQITNARLIGTRAHARDYLYTSGQRLQFDLTAPDYDAYVYVDYFDANGDVIHLVPNDIVALQQHRAKTVFGVGSDGTGGPGLNITIGPPFGQEIAVAFAASHRLYDGLRPMTEPAAPYLAFLKTRIAKARADTTDFKGEWVYFFITTQPGPD